MLLSKRSILSKLLTLYFSLTLFNNPAFEISGVSLSDVFGILACIVFFARGLFDWDDLLKINRLSLLLFAAVALIFCHQLVIGSFYGELNSSGAWITRAAVTFKIIMFAGIVWIFNREFQDIDSVHWLLDWIVSFAIIGVAAYLIQCVLLATGRLPYGTFFDAGYVGVPAFGSVSIERGHFGKFMTPLFPFFLLVYVKHKRRLAWIGFLFVTVINISASSLSFFAAYVICTLTAYRSILKRPKYLMGGLVLLGFIAAGCVAFREVLWGVVNKIITAAFQGQAGGGRGFSNFLDYLRLYPFGMSYGGSSLRNISSLDEMNSGMMAFFTQFGVISPIMLISYMTMLVIAVRKAKQIPDTLTRRMMIIGILMTAFIFSTDVLWFVPTIWLPILISMTGGMQHGKCEICYVASLPKRVGLIKRFFALATASIA